mmetsp:Transcript_27141/g.33011  ORF Transcript_27141/g.33011 Transcript_27141/m.33011 type:complete len:143 (-) Transcript_27141:2333-2761(-)
MGSQEDVGLIIFIAGVVFATFFGVSFLYQVLGKNRTSPKSSLVVERSKSYKSRSRPEEVNHSTSRDDDFAFNLDEPVTGSPAMFSKHSPRSGVTGTSRRLSFENQGGMISSTVTTPEKRSFSFRKSNQPQDKTDKHDVGALI